jgi:hypothetical protein
MELSLPPKLVEKLVWVPVTSFCKFSFPVMGLMPYYAGRFRPLIASLYGQCLRSNMHECCHVMQGLYEFNYSEYFTLLLLSMTSRRFF